MLKTPSLRNALIGISRQFEHIKPDTLTEDFARIVNGSPEDKLGATDGSSLAAPGEASDAMAPAQMGKQEALKRFATEPDREGAQGRDRSGERPRRGDPADHRHPDAPPAEQSDSDRRGGRRQDRGGRRLRAAAGAGRRAAAAAERVVVHARHRPAAGRREHEGRVREPAAAGDRRGAGVAQADHPVRRRGAHADRRGRGGGHGRRGEPAQAGAGARHAAHDRRDDVGRIQEVHREGSGADPALPGREGRGAERGQGDPDGARRRVHSREASPGAGARRGARSGRAAVASLHSRRGSCRTRRSACSTPRARAWPSASTACRRSSRTAGGRSRRCRPSWRSSAARRPSASTRTSAGRRRKRSSRRASTRRESLEERWKAERELVERVLAIRAKLRQGSEPVEGTGSKLEQAAEAQKAARRRRARPPKR